MEKTSGKVLWDINTYAHVLVVTITILGLFFGGLGMRIWVLTDGTGVSSEVGQTHRGGIINKKVCFVSLFHENIRRVT